jgi:hypothetical protein
MAIAPRAGLQRLGDAPFLPGHWRAERYQIIDLEHHSHFGNVYILDPADGKGPTYPSETFRVPKKNQIARFGTYRTARLVLAARHRTQRSSPHECRSEP